MLLNITNDWKYNFHPISTHITETSYLKVETYLLNSSKQINLCTFVLMSKKGNSVLMYLCLKAKI